MLNFVKIEHRNGNYHLHDLANLKINFKIKSGIFNIDAALRIQNILYLYDSILLAWFFQTVLIVQCITDDVPFCYKILSTLLVKKKKITYRYH